MLHGHSATLRVACNGLRVGPTILESIPGSYVACQSSGRPNLSTALQVPFNGEFRVAGVTAIWLRGILLLEMVSEVGLLGVCDQ